MEQEETPMNHVTASYGTTADEAKALAMKAAPFLRGDAKERAIAEFVKLVFPAFCGFIRLLWQAISRGLLRRTLNRRVLVGKAETSSIVDL
jgi:hypothetical protein